MPMTTEVVLKTADDRYQVLSSLLTSRSKRHRRGRFIVQGVRPVTLALEAGWPLEAVIGRAGGRLSRWAAGVWDEAPVATRYRVTDALMVGLCGKEEPAEVLLVARVPERSLADVPVGSSTVICVVDRIASPGNLGSIIRSADAFGAAGVVTVGHAADPYDPACVRASTGSIFNVPVVAAADMAAVTTWCAAPASSAGWPAVRLVGADESSPTLAAGDLAPPVAIVLGSEGRGLSRSAVDACERLVSVPMVGKASSLNVASAATVLLYESRRR